MTEESAVSTIVRPSIQTQSNAIPTGSQGLGWFLRRTRSPRALANFYESGLGLARLRSWDTPNTTGEMLWCGDVGVVELNRLDHSVTLAPEDSPCIPVFGTMDAAESMRRAVSAGAKAISGTFPSHFEIMAFSDPDGFIFGIEQISAELARFKSRADKTWPGGIANLPGGISIDGPIQCISKIFHKTVDPAREWEFLTSLGFHATSKSSITLGGVTEIILEQDLRGRMPAPLENREMAHDTWVARVYGLENYRSALRSRDGTLLSSHEFPGGVLDYALSPSNIIFGWQERKSYHPDIPTTQMIEDLAARTYWINSSKTQSD